MKKIMIFCTLMVVIFVSVLFLSPKPTIWLLQHSLFSIPKDSRPAQYQEPNVIVSTNLTYPSKFQKNTFDFYKTKVSLAHQPVVIWVHGGGFVGGDKLEVKAYATELASQGYFVFVLNYELVPTAKYPEPVIQVSEAIRYIKTSFAKQHNLNMANIFIAGDSAGAQIALQFLLIQSNPQYADLLNIQETLNPSDIRGGLLYCGPYDLKNMVLQANSAITRFAFGRIGWAYLEDKDWLTRTEDKGLVVSEYLNAALPPIYLTDGNTASFEQQARQLEKQLQKVGVATKSRYFDQKTDPTAHEYQFLLDTKPAQLTLKDTLQFMDTYRQK